MRRSHARFWLVGLLALAGACDGGPQGSGDLSATIEGPAPLGAAVLEVRGPGITGFEAAGATQVFSATPEEGVHRVVLVSDPAGDLRFRVRVSNLGDPLPTATLISAADGANLPVTSMHAFQVRITR